MARIKGALATRKRRNKNIKAGKGLLGRQEQTFQDCQGSCLEVRSVRLHQQTFKEERFQKALDRKNQCRLQDERYKLFYIHQRLKEG